MLLAGVLALYSVMAGTELRPEKLAGITMNHRIPLSAAGVAVSICAVAGLFFVRRTLLDATETKSQDYLRAYIFLRSKLHVFLFTAAIILSLGVLGTAALRSALNADQHSNCFPAQYVIICGAIFTLLLLIAYVPIQATFWQVGTGIVQQIMGSPPASPSELAKWLDGKGKLEKALDLDLTSASALIGPVAAILPLLSGWISTLLGQGAKPLSDAHDVLTHSRGRKRRPTSSSRFPRRGVCGAPLNVSTFREDDRL